ncbi:hypothetical protein OF83DRAFT_1171969, partial [Amylostereum chailletii]
MSMVLKSSGGLSDNDDDVALQGALIEMKRYHNQKLPIARLLPEILSIIFRICRNEDTKKHSPEKYVYMSPGGQLPCVEWLDVVSVCHDWRQIALADRNLWTDIYLPSIHPKMAETMISRSRDAKLALYCRNDTLPSPITVVPLEQSRKRRMEEVVRNYQDRIKEFHIITKDPSFASSLFSHPLPSLEVLD